MDWIKTLMQREFELRPKMLPAADQAPYLMYEGSIPILVSAAHSTHHTRNGRPKYGEAFTGGFARLIAEQSGAFALYPRYRQADDPNYSADSPYKTELKRLIEQHDIRFVLDLHGCTNRHGFGLALGTIYGRSCPSVQPIFESAFVEHGWKEISPAQAEHLETLDPFCFVVNFPKFAGGFEQHTTTRYVSQTLQVAAAQLEICSSLRVPFERWGGKYFRGDAAHITKTLQMLISVIGEISNAVR